MKTGEKGMAIEITGLPTATSMTTGNNGQTDAAKDHTGQAPVPGQISAKIVDNVTLTQEARHLSMIEASLSTQPEIDHQRVAKLKQEIDSGQYTINPERVADKLVRFETQLMG
jgi:negative regulator of flagellin synthesis FlgM